MNILKTGLLCALLVTAGKALGQDSHPEETTSPAASVVALRSYPYEFSDHRFAADFSKTLIFGNSISSNLRTSLMGMAFSALDLTSGYEVSPGDILSSVYAGKPVYENVAVGLASFHLSPFGFIFQNYELGLGRLLEFIGQSAAIPGTPDPKAVQIQAYYQQSTAVVGVDAFYMGVLFNECADLNPAAVVGNFVEKAFQDGKVAILGNMPDEKFDRMSWLAKKVITYAAQPGWQQCKTLVNNALKNYCVAEKNCYLVDLETIVNNMDKNDGATLTTDNKKYTYAQLRPDGANLSAAGTQLIIESVLSEMAAHPPQVPTGTTAPQP